MNNSYITIIKEKRTDLSRKRIPLNQNKCTADFRMSVPFEQNLHLLIMFAVIESNGISVNAAESIKAEHEETNYAIGYLVPTTSTYSFTEEGGVATDGLRLRKEPSFDSTILELMYFGEVVKIDLDKSTMWSYVKI